MTDETQGRELPRKPFPKLCYHKGTRRFFIDWQGAWRYWPTGTIRAIAQADYDAMRDAYASGGTVQLPNASRRSARTVDALIDAYLAHCDAYYANSKATVGNIERALTPLHEQFGRRPIDSIGPRLLREVRESLIEKKFTRLVINQRVQSIVRMFKWAVAEELVPPSIYEGLRAIEGLRAGRTTAPEGPGRRPVAWAHVEPVLPHVSREVAAMLVIQAESGARPGEIVQMRSIDLDRTGKVWTYKPQRHKTQYLGKTRLVPLFAVAQAALEPLLHRVPPLPPEARIFSPQRAENSRRVERRLTRKTRVQPSQADRAARPSSGRKRPLREAYDVNTYARAVRRGIDAANAASLREELIRAIVPLYPDKGQSDAAERFRALPASVLSIASSTQPDVVSRELERLRCVLQRGLGKPNGSTSSVCEQMLAIARHAAEQLRPKLIPYWSPYQLRHRFATEGEQRFGQMAVSLAMGHASLRMTEHYIERNLKAVFEQMSQGG